MYHVLEEAVENIGARNAALHAASWVQFSALAALLLFTTSTRLACGLENHTTDFLPMNTPFTYSAIQSCFAAGAAVAGGRGGGRCALDCGPGPVPTLLVVSGAVI